MKESISMYTIGVIFGIMLFKLVNIQKVTLEIKPLVLFIIMIACSLLGIYIGYNIKIIQKLLNKRSKKNENKLR